MLAQINFALPALGGEGGDVETVVVKDGVEKLEAVVVEELGDFVTDEAALLQASDMRLEGQGLVAAADVQAGNIESDAGAYAGGAGGSSGSGRAGRFRIPDRSHR